MLIWWSNHSKPDLSAFQTCSPTLWCWCYIPDKTGHLHEVPADVGQHGGLHLRAADFLSHTQVGVKVTGTEFTCQR